MQDDQKYGLLINQNAKIHRQYFREAVKLLGIRVLYRAPLPGKKYTTYAEVDTCYAPPLLVGCLFHNKPTQQTMKKLGWMAELNSGESLIEVDYDLPGLQVGALFIIPSGIDDGKARVFRVTKMINSMVYPSSITCSIVPEYIDLLDREEVKDTSNSDFNLAKEEHWHAPYKPLGLHQFKIKEEEDQWT